jgi:hypothetical protein
MDRRAAGLVWRAGPRSMVEDVNFSVWAGTQKFFAELRIFPGLRSRHRISRRMWGRNIRAYG